MTSVVAIKDFVDAVRKKKEERRDGERERERQRGNVKFP